MLVRLRRKEKPLTLLVGTVLFSLFKYFWPFLIILRGFYPHVTWELRRGDRCSEGQGLVVPRENPLCLLILEAPHHLVLIHVQYLKLQICSPGLQSSCYPKFSLGYKHWTPPLNMRPLQHTFALLSPISPIWFHFHTLPNRHYSRNIFVISASFPLRY